MHKILFAIISIIQLSQAENNVTLETFKELKPLNHPGVKLLNFTKKESLYMIHANVLYQGVEKKIDIFVTENLKQVIFGNAFYTDSGKQILTPIDTSSLKLLTLFSEGDGDNEYFIFSSPGCVACKKFSKLIKEKGIKKNVKLHMLLYPMQHFKNAYKEANYLFSIPKDKRLEAYYNAMDNNLTIDKNFNETKKSKELILKSKKLANSLSITGTPFIINKYGQKISWEQIIKIKKLN